MKRPTVYKASAIIVFMALIGYIAYQQAQIDELATRVYGQYNMSDSDSFGYRISNLEHIINNHTARIKDLEKEVWTLQKQNNALQWRVMQLEWLHPELTVQPTKVLQTDTKMIDFNPNPQNVPSPLNKGESIFQNGGQ